MVHLFFKDGPFCNPFNNNNMQFKLMIEPNTNEPNAKT